MMNPSKLFKTFWGFLAYLFSWTVYIHLHVIQVSLFVLEVSHWIAMITFDPF